MARRFPNWLFLREVSEREYFLKRDREENYKTRITPFEKVRQTALWGVEIFGPSEVSSLYESIELLDWNFDNFILDRNSLIKWISEQRTNELGGYYNLGMISPTSESQSTFGGRTAPMPDSVQYMTGKVYQVTASVTVVIVCMVFKEGSDVDYERALAEDQATRYERVKTGRKRHYIVPGVENLKQRAVENVRLQAKRDMSLWFAENLPGFFSNNSDDGILPTAELITTTTEKLFSTHRETYENHRWKWLLSGCGIGDEWKSKNSNGLSLIIEREKKHYRNHLIINLRTFFIRDDEVEFRGGRSAQSYTSLVDDYVNGIVAQYSVTAFLQESSRLVRNASDNLPDARRGRRATLKAIDHIETFFGKSAGLPGMISEIEDKSKRRAFYWDSGAFVSTPVSDGVESVDITNGLDMQIRRLAITALKQNQGTRSHFEKLSSIYGARESIQTQRRMELMTITMTILAALALVITLVSSVGENNIQNPVTPLPSKGEIKNS